MLTVLRPVCDLGLAAVILVSVCVVFRSHLEVAWQPRQVVEGNERILKVRNSENKD